MHLPLIRTGISVKAGSGFVPPAVASQHSLSHCVFGAPRTCFGAVRPSLPALFPSRPRDVTPVSSSFGRSLPLASLQFRPRSAALFL
ncbi:hypothetical protein TNCV_2169791 [Trichonephila clavipes]|nr:hypothetical protein TNCV_2169791 [Trichonephila clavipes]